MKTGPALASFDDFGNWIPALPAEEIRPPLVSPSEASPSSGLSHRSRRIRLHSRRHISLSSVLYAPGSAGFEVGVAFYVYCAFSGAYSSPSRFSAMAFRAAASGASPISSSPRRASRGPASKASSRRF